MEKYYDTYDISMIVYMEAYWKKMPAPCDTHVMWRRIKADFAFWFDTELAKAA